MSEYGTIGDLDCVLNFDKENDDIKAIKFKIAKMIEERARTDSSINGTVTANENISPTT